MKMQEDENIPKFIVRICDISKNFFTLGEKMYEEKLIRTIQRSMPKMFDMNVTPLKNLKMFPQ